MPTPLPVAAALASQRRIWLIADHVAIAGPGLAFDCREERALRQGVFRA